MGNVVELQGWKQEKLSTDITVITAEINSYKQIAGHAIFEIGRRLKHVKENDLVHGEWAKWCEKDVGMSRGQATKFITVYEKLSSNGSTSNQLGVEALYQIATLPEPERTKQHQIPSTGEVKTVDEMTVRELREVKRKLKEEQQARGQAEKDKEKLVKENQELKNKPPEIKEVEVEKVIHLEREVLPEGLERRMRELEEQAREALEYKQELDKYKLQFGLLENQRDGVTRIPNRVDVTGTMLAYVEDVRGFIKKYAHLENYTSEISDIDGIARREYIEATNVLLQFLTALKGNLTGNSNIIDIKEVH